MATKPLDYLNEVVIPHRADECLFWPFNRVAFGYGRISIDGKQRYVHRIVCAATHGPSALHAAHSCGNGHLGCVNPSHLRWATLSENNHDKIKHGTSSRGTKNPTAKLTDENVREIRRLKGTMTQNALAAKFGVSKQTISLLLKGGVWGWVD